MKVEINYNKCRKSGECIRICPEVFSIEDGKILIKFREIPPDYIDDVLEAIKSCPNHALKAVLKPE